MRWRTPGRPSPRGPWSPPSRSSRRRWAASPWRARPSCCGARSRPPTSGSGSSWSRRTTWSPTEGIDARYERYFMTTKGSGRTRLGVGLIGLGRLGRVYARDLASRIPEARLVAVADTNGALAGQIAAEFDVPRAFDDPMELLHSTDVDAAVIASPTHTHKALVIAA